MRTRSVPPRQGFHPGRIGPYEVLRRLGAGAMGEVYLARTPSSRLVAVKTIRAGLAEHPGYRRRFAHEVDAARRVSGAFTAAVVDADAHADLPWLATVYVPAPSIEELVAACGPLPVPAVRWLAAGCAEALQCVHKAGLVHRDLKPANVLVTAEGPRVIDFGLARTDGLPQGTMAGMVLGTPLYMAPEQAAGTSDAGQAADVFSLGATLIHAATGHPPYREAKAMPAILQLMSESPDLSAVPEELRRELGPCLALEPADRPTPAALIRTLAPHLGGPEPAPPLPAAVLDYVEDYRNTQMELARPRRSHPVPGPMASTERGTHGGGRMSGAEADTATGDEAVADTDTDTDADMDVPAPGGGARQPHPSLLPPEAPNRHHQRTRAGEWRIPPSAFAAGATLALMVAVVGVLLLAGVLRLGGGPARQAAAPPAPAASPPPAPDGGPGRPPDRPPGPPPGAFTESAGISLGVRPPFGDPHTTFVLHGSGWPPGASVTITLVGMGTSTQALVDGGGEFSYAVDQHHELIPGDLPDGRYHIRAVLGSVTETVSFVIGPPLNP